MDTQMKIIVSRRLYSHLRQEEVTLSSDGAFADFQCKHGGRIEDVNLQNVSLRNVKMPGTIMSDVSFRGASMNDVSLCDGSFQMVDISCGRFTDCDFHNSRFVDCNFTDAAFVRVNFSGAEFRNVNMRNTRFRCVDFAEADFSREVDVFDAEFPETALSMVRTKYGEDRSNIIDGGTRSDGYSFYLTFSIDDPSKIVIRAGCRRFESFAEAEKHWIEKRHGTYLGYDTMTILEFMKQKYKMRTGLYPV